MALDPETTDRLERFDRRLDTYEARLTRKEKEIEELANALRVLAEQLAADERRGGKRHGLAHR